VKPMSKIKLEEDVSLVLCGEAGQGIQSVENIMVQALKMGGYHVFSTKEYMSRVRGGQNSTQIRASSKRVKAYRDRIDILVALSKGAIPHLEKRITGNTLILGDEEVLQDLDENHYNLLKAPFISKAKKLGGLIFSNVIAAGALSCIMGVDKDIFDELITLLFASKGEKILEKDLKAGVSGYDIGKKLLDSGRISIKIEKNPAISNEILINGTQAVGSGCISGGCKFISAYPMTPSSPLQVFMAENASEFEMVFEQAEDEIAALNMALGASYAGARAMTATSGSGFALMQEAVGLAGMIETPVVIYIAQRPGPAVGLPTRTAQEDLNLALYSGPGGFPRIIFAPGNFKDALELSHKSFNLADKYQIPVFILSDQYLADIYYNLPSLDIENLDVEDYLVETEADYKRYLLTPDGISPRGIPGHGKGLVCADSDEHDEEGHITEDLDLRTLMVDKRLKKMDKIRKEAVPGEFFSTLNSSQYKTLIMGWGSTYWPLKEALVEMDNDDLALLHLKQLYPLSSQVGELIKKAKKSVMFENNAQGQMAHLLQMETGLKIDHKVLKYNGMPFSVEEILIVLETLEEE